MHARIGTCLLKTLGAAVKQQLQQPPNSALRCLCPAAWTSAAAPPPSPLSWCPRRGLRRCAMRRQCSGARSGCACGSSCRWAGWAGRGQPVPHLAWLHGAWPLCAPLGCWLGWLHMRQRLQVAYGDGQEQRHAMAITSLRCTTCCLYHLTLDRPAALHRRRPAPLAACPWMALEHAGTRTSPCCPACWRRQRARWAAARLHRLPCPARRATPRRSRPCLAWAAAPDAVFVC